MPALLFTTPKMPVLPRLQPTSAFEPALATLAPCRMLSKDHFATDCFHTTSGYVEQPCFYTRCTAGLTQKSGSLSHFSSCERLEAIVGFV